MAKSIFSQNLRKARQQKGWTQEQAAAMIGIKRSLLGAYEEDRADPPHATLTSIAEAYHVEDDLYGFLNNINFYDEKGRRSNIRKVSLLEKKYHALKPPIRQAVDALMKVNSSPSQTI